MADYQQNFLASLHGGMDFGQRMKGIGDQSKLNQLAAQSYSTPPDQRDSLLAQMAGVDAGSAFQAEKQMAYSDERRNTNMVNMAKLLTNAPPQARAGLYRSMVPTLSRFGLSEMPQEYNDQTAPMIDQAAQSIVQAYQGQGGGMLQSQKIGADGFIYNTFRDGRMVNTGIKADRQAWFRDQEGFAPEIVNKDGTTTQLGGASGGTNFTTSDGVPFDVSQVTDPYVRQQILSNPDAYGMAPSGTRATLPATNVSPAQYGSRTRPSAAQSAADSARAKIDVENANFENELEQQRRLKEQEARIEADKAGAVQTAKDQAERAAQAPKRIKQYEQALTASKSVRDALGKAINLVGATTTGWAGARMRNIEGSDAFDLNSQIETVKANLGFDRLQEMRDNSPTGGALGAIAVQELVALQSTIANLDPNQSADQLKSNLQKVEQHYQNWETAVRNALDDERRNGTAAPSGGQRTIVRTGTSNGRKVIQYSDGSVEYGN